MGFFDQIAGALHEGQHHRRRGGTEVAGPYRSQSSVPSINRQATRHEHRTVNPWDVVDPPDVPAIDNPTRALSAPLVHLAAPTADLPAGGPLGSLATLIHTRQLDPQTAYSNALLTGREPPVGVRDRWRNEYGPGLYAQIAKAAHEKVRSQEGIQADPIAELAINLAATAGVGTLANALRGGAVAAETAAGAAGAEGGADLATQAATGNRIANLISGARAAPQAVRSELEGLATRAGQKAAAQRAGEAAAGQALRHPLYSKTAILGALNTAGIKGGGVDAPGALVRGSWNAITNDPVQVGETTARGLAGAVTASAALLYAADDSIAHGTPAPFLNTAGAMAQGTADIGANLLSGNDATVQKAVEDEVGLAFLPLLPAITKTARYEAARSGVRDAAKELRGRINERTPLDLRYGPEEQYLFGKLEKRDQRRAAAEQGQVAVRPEELRSSKHRAPVEKAARKLPTARSLRNMTGIQAGDVISTLAEYGITKPEQIALLRERGPKPSPDARPGDANLGAVLDHLEQNPSLITHPKMREILDQHYPANVENLPLQKAGHGERAAALPQAQLFGIRDAVDRVPFKAREFTKAEDRAGAWKDLTGSERRAKELRHQARGQMHEASARDLAGHGAVARKLRDNARGLYSEARKLEDRNRGLRKALNKYSRPGSAVSSRARRQLWDPQLVKEMVDETNAAAAKAGMKPGVYVHHGQLRDEGEMASVFRGSGKGTSVQHIRRADEFSLAATDQVNRSLSALLEGSFEAPRRRAGLQKFARTFFSKRAIRIAVKGAEQKKARVTRRQFSEAIRDRQIGESHYVWVPEAEYKRPFTDVAAQHDIHSGAEKRLNAEIKDDPGSYGVIVPRESYKEYAAQVNPTQGLASKFANALSKSAGRVLLFSPAWVEAQAVAEALPMLMARPRLADPFYLRRLHKAIGEAKGIDKEAATGWAAAMGEAPVRAATARELSPGYQPSHSMFYNAARAAEHNPVGRGLFSTVRMRPFVLFDQWRQGKYRQILAAADLDKELNGFFNGLQGALRGQKKVSDELRGMPLGKQIVEIERNPRYRHMLDENRKYVEAIAGNWTAFTRFEQKFGPAAVFYGFIRYAFRWPLAFAKHHPISAEVNYFLAQQNAEQIEKILHGNAPTSFFEYANPVVHGADGSAKETSILPGGARIAPGLSAPAQGLLSGNAPQAAVGSLNPGYAALVGLITGTNSFGETEDATKAGLFGLHWSLAAKSLMTTPPLLRLAGIGESNSETAQDLHAHDKNRKLRSFAAPWLPQSGADYAHNQGVIRDIEQYEQEKADNGGYPPSSSSSSSTNPWDAVTPEASSSNPWDSVEIP